MFITTKGRYALRVLLYLADRYGLESVSLKKIAADEEISLKYLEHIMSTLVQQGFVKSTKGSKGGYSLAQPPSACSVGKILRALENDLCLVPCLDEELNPCKRADRCTTIEVWKLLQDTINELIDNLTLLDLLRMQQDKRYVSCLYVFFRHVLKCGDKKTTAAIPFVRGLRLLCYSITTKSPCCFLLPFLTALLSGFV